MRAPLSGALATISIFIPLVAVPLLALFGMPQMSGTLASTQSDDLKFVDQASTNLAPAVAQSAATDPASPSKSSSVSAPASDTATGAEQSHDGTGAKAGQADPFADFVRPAASEIGHKQQAAVSEVQTSLPVKREQLATIDEGNGLPQKSLVAFSKGDKEKAAEGRSAAKGSTLNWKDAIDRLNALGIRDFQLQPGVRDGEFLFSCRLNARTNPRITRRFEAEASEPLEAVTEVLRQIDDWRSGGTPPSSRTATSDRQTNINTGDPFEDSESVSTVNMTNR